MKRICIALAAIGGLTGTSAYAADMALKTAPTRTPASDWSGIYVGIEGGGAWDDVTWRNAARLFGGPSYNFNASGGIGGGFVGVQKQFRRNWILGVEASFDATSLKNSVRDPVLPTDIYTTNVTSVGAVDGKIGYATNGWLSYLKAGWAWGNVKGSGLARANGDTFGATLHYSGWNAAVGLERAITPNWIAGVEYDHYDLGSQNCACTSALGVAVTYNQRANIDAAMARLSYKFGM